MPGNALFQTERTLAFILEITTPTMSFFHADTFSCPVYSFLSLLCLAESRQSQVIVEELAQLGGYTVATFRRIFNFCFSSTGVRVDDETEEGSVVMNFVIRMLLPRDCYKYGDLKSFAVTFLLPSFLVIISAAFCCLSA